VAPGAAAAELKGVRFPAQTHDHGKELFLNGVGVRKKSIFNVDVYVAGLYLEAPSRDDHAILGSDGVKKLVLVFLREAPADKVIQDWNASFQKNCAQDCDKLTASLGRFNSLITDLHRGQEVDMTFSPQGLKLTSHGHTEEIRDAKFASVTLAAFIGPKLRGDTVRDALLSGGPLVQA
ncbi:MAG: chalcone isomerase family protein, partial [Bdellovibrionota bacterium]